MELLLSMGATRWEASREMIQRCIRLAMTPVLNQMNVVGIVSIPGMMTGQILGGTDPSQARPPRFRTVFRHRVADHGSGEVWHLSCCAATGTDRPELLRD